MKRPLVVFDLDDTLYKESNFVLSGLKAIAQNEPAAPIANIPAQEILKRMSALPGVPDAFARVLSDISGTQDNIDHILDIYRTHHPKIGLSQDTESLLVHLKKYCDLALITDGRSKTQRNKIRSLGLERFFDEDSIFISEEVGGDKTTSLQFKAAMRKYPDANYRFYIGDNVAKDFHYPNLLGWTTIMLRDSKNENIFPHDLRRVKAAEYLPRYIIETLSDLLKFRQIYTL